MKIIFSSVGVALLFFTCTVCFASWGDPAFDERVALRRAERDVLVNALDLRGDLNSRFERCVRVGAYDEILRFLQGVYDVRLLNLQHPSDLSTGVHTVIFSYGFSDDDLDLRNRYTFILRAFLEFRDRFGHMINLNIRNFLGSTPLTEAIDAKWVFGVEALLAHRDEQTMLDVDVNLADFREFTPFISACNGGFEDGVRLLLEHRNNDGVKAVNVNAHSRKGDTGFIWAAVNGYPGIVRLLLDARNDDGSWRVDVNAVNLNNETALWWAAATGRKDIVELLVNGIDAYGRRRVHLGIRNNDGKNAADIAEEKHFDVIARMLRSFE